VKSRESETNAHKCLCSQSILDFRFGNGHLQNSLQCRYSCYFIQWSVSYCLFHQSAISTHCVSTTEACSCKAFIFSFFSVIFLKTMKGKTIFFSKRAGGIGLCSYKPLWSRHSGSKSQIDGIDSRTRTIV
jgi:hypothetical protein